jgi:hypothetical protein
MELALDVGWPSSRLSAMQSCNLDRVLDTDLDADVGLDVDSNFSLSLLCRKLACNDDQQLAEDTLDRCSSPAIVEGVAGRGEVGSSRAFDQSGSTLRCGFAKFAKLLKADQYSVPHILLVELANVGWLSSAPHAECMGSSTDS